MHPSPRLPELLLLLTALLSAGCVQTRYLVQAAGGQWDLMRRSRPLRQVVQDGRQPARVRALLSQVPHIKRWAEAQGLNRTRNYDHYADLQRPAAVWVVQAAPRLELTERAWSFPIVGTVPYLGFFDETEAQAFARELELAEDLDVDVRTAAAYSTLGWLRDPVLSTMISDGPEALGELVNIVLHESVHATVYVPGQSAFDESLASFVADRMTVQWLEEVTGPDAPQTKVWKRYQQETERRIALMNQAYDELEALYASARPDAEKLAEKARILGALQAALGTTRVINNASLAGLKKYGTGTDGFVRLFEACGRNWSRFLRAVGGLTEADFPEPQTTTFAPILEAIASRGCP